MDQTEKLQELMQELSYLQGQIDQVQIKIKEILEAQALERSDLSLSKTDLSSTETDLSSIETDLASTETDLSSPENTALNPAVFEFMDMESLEEQYSFLSELNPEKLKEVDVDTMAMAVNLTVEGESTAERLEDLMECIKKLSKWDHPRR